MKVKCNHRLSVVCLYVSVCPQEMDMGYGIPWDSTVPGETSLQSCGAGCKGKCINKKLKLFIL